MMLQAYSLAGCFLQIAGCRCLYFSVPRSLVNNLDGSVDVPIYTSTGFKIPAILYPSLLLGTKVDQ